MNQNLSSENLEGVVTVASDSLVDGQQLKLKAVTMATVQQIQDVGQHGGIYAHIQDSIIHCLLILRIDSIGSQLLIKNKKLKGTESAHE